MERDEKDRGKKVLKTVCTILWIVMIVIAIFFYIPFSVRFLDTAIRFLFPPDCDRIKRNFEVLEIRNIQVHGLC